MWADLVARTTWDEEDTANPDGSPIHGAPYTALIVSGEDSIKTTIKPRLRVAGAEQSRVAFMPLRLDSNGEVIPFTIPDDLRRLRTNIRALRQRGPCGLVIIDPLAAFVSAEVNTNNDANVRHKVLLPLLQLAERENIAIICLRHWNKDVSMKAIYRGGGSIAVSAAFRSVLQVIPHPDDPDVSVLAQAKPNLTGKIQSQMYRVVESSDPKQPEIQWLGFSDLTADQLARMSSDGRLAAPERKEAAHIILDVLADGPAPVKDYTRAVVKVAGLSDSTRKRAERQLKLHKYPLRDEAGHYGEWYAHLPSGVNGGMSCPPECGRYRAEVGHGQE